VNTGTGYNSNLSTDLSNDHPIAFGYNTLLATSDGELIDPASTTYIDSRLGRSAAGAAATKNRMAVPLENGSLECTSCHDPHVRGTNGEEGTNIKFLRLNRFQKTTQPSGAAFNVATDIGCLACHKKAGWENSTHAHAQVADETYADAAAATREFPKNIQVWQASCLSCHDAHTVPGAERLLREGTDDINTPKQAGGNPSVDDSCYQCHTSLANADQVLTDVTAVADIEAVDGKAANHRPVIVSKVHNVLTADLTEDADPNAVPSLNLGSGHNTQCSDCHHPHRMISNATVTSSPTTPAPGKGKHVHTAGVAHNNIASGALRGVTGVEPTTLTPTTSASFDPSNGTLTYAFKKGDPGASPGTDVIESYTTREYQVCMKCHSSYANTPAANVSNTAMEFNADISEAGEPGGNHLSWHPVMVGTNRSVTTGGAAAETFVAPFNTAVGTQTMYCSDCHTNNDVTGPKGPHGSNVPKVLAGPWNSNTGKLGSENDLCFSCHKFNEYGQGGTGVEQSGFSCVGCTTPLSGFSDNNLHLGHMQTNPNVKEDGPAGAATAKQVVCQDCHVRLTHGWKKKGMLADKNDLAGGFESTYFDPAVSRLRVATYRASGAWTKADCTTCH
ncbi:MAG: cytochrome c3 family protein, partial [Gammaproteobacteria bacterium]|nr:cytochrome c3 family protein [Gammaproteobacteria bacterium]